MSTIAAGVLVLAMVALRAGLAWRLGLWLRA